MRHAATAAVLVLFAACADFERQEAPKEKKVSRPAAAESKEPEYKPPDYPFFKDDGTAVPLGMEYMSEPFWPSFSGYGYWAGTLGYWPFWGPFYASRWRYRGWP